MQMEVDDKNQHILDALSAGRREQADLSRQLVLVSEVASASKEHGDILREAQARASNEASARRAQLQVTYMNSL